MKSTWTIKQPFGNLFKLLTTFFLIILAPLVIITAWVNWSLAPVGVGKPEKIFVINRGESAISFSDRLQKDGLIRSALMFRIYLKLSELDKKIQAGSFRLSPYKNAEDVAFALTRGRLDKWVTIIEGLRKEEVAEVLAKNIKIKKETFINKAEEGRLFPDTYLIPLDANEEKILEIFKINFDKKFGESLKKIKEESSLSNDEIIILASIIERETLTKEERSIIAGILIKRLNDGSPLGVDASIQYVLGYSEEEKSWWRKIITEEDLKMKSPFNTRENVGLPPSPICSPGLAAINAALNPQESPYYFYIHDNKGKVHYGKTFEEHQKNINDYL